MSGNVSEYKLSGDWFQMGVELGKAESLEIRKFNDRYFSDPVNLFRFGSADRVWHCAGKLVEQMREYSPSSFRFLEGIAEGAGLPLEQAAAQSCLPELTHINSEPDYGPLGCTACYLSASASAGQSALIAENWDFSTDLPNWYVLRLYGPLGEPARLVVGAGAMFACCGVSSLGLAVSFTTSGHLPNVPPASGLPVVALIIEVLGSQGFYDAMDVAVAPPRAGAFNMIIADEYTHGALIEAVPDRVEIIEHDKTLICTNHFQHPGMVQWTSQDLNPPEEPAQEFARASVGRRERLHELLSSAEVAGVDLDLLTGSLRDHESQRPREFAAVDLCPSRKHHSRVQHEGIGNIGTRPASPENLPDPTVRGRI